MTHDDPFAPLKERLGALGFRYVGSRRDVLHLAGFAVTRSIEANVVSVEQRRLDGDGKPFVVRLPLADVALARVLDDLAHRLERNRAEEKGRRWPGSPPRGRDESRPR